MKPFVIGIRFQNIGKTYHFNASNCSNIQVGDFAIVDTSRGCQLGEVMQIVENPPPPPEGTWKPIIRIATAQDLVLRQVWQKKEIEAVVNCRAKMEELNILGVKIVSAEYTFDGRRLTFIYNTETEGKVDLHQLRSTMQRMYGRTRVGMRQIGPRDVAKIIGGLGACGMGVRCCSMFLTEFSPISIRMAKEQRISLTPSEITGMCGRLRCCLLYEYEQYVDACKVLPKRKTHIITPQGEGYVVDHYPLKQSIVVQLESGKKVEVSLDELEPKEELEALQKKALHTSSDPEGGRVNKEKQSNMNRKKRSGSRKSRSSRRTWRKK